MNESAALPRWAKQIDSRLSSLLGKYEVEGPVCHVGSLINKDNTTDEQVKRWRDQFAHLPNPGFVGIDLFPGKNVDVVADLCSENFVAANAALVESFGLVLCSALLEHVLNPFDAARNIARLVKPSGYLYFAGPWVWGYHPYPNDYWRISFSAIQALFKNFEWKQWWYTGTKQGVGIEISDVSRERKLFAQKSVAGPATLITDRGMPYLNIAAIGQRTALS